MSETAYAITSTVSWTTAWVILVAVASNSIMQSSLSSMFPPNLDYCFRCSPFHCASTAFALLIRFTVYVSRGNSISTSARETLKYHLVLDDLRFPRRGGFVVQKTSGIRFALFIFAALLPTVKLIGMSGLPWTQAFVGMFMGSYVIVEVMVLLASRASEPTNDLTESLSFQEKSLDQDPTDALQSHLYWVDIRCFRLAMFIHFLCLVAAYGAVLGTLFPFSLVPIN